MTDSKVSEFITRAPVKIENYCFVLDFSINLVALRESCDRRINWRTRIPLYIVIFIRQFPYLLLVSIFYLHVIRSQHDYVELLLPKAD